MVKNYDQASIRVPWTKDVGSYTKMSNDLFQSSNVMKNELSSFEINLFSAVSRIDLISGSEMVNHPSISSFENGPVQLGSD